jgi:hypothetical protein
MNFRIAGKMVRLLAKGVFCLGASLFIAADPTGCNPVSVGGSCPSTGRTATPGTNDITVTSSPSGDNCSDEINWTTSSPSAVVRFDGTSLKKGSVQLEILDGAGNIVENASISSSVQASSLNGSTRGGTAGQWLLRLDYSNATGTLNFTVTGSQ